MAGVVVPLVTFLPAGLTGTTRLWELGAGRWAVNPEVFPALGATYVWMSQNTGLPALAGLALLGAVLAAGHTRRPDGDAQPNTLPPPHELAAAIALAAVPVLMVALTTLLGRPYTPRYALNSVAGFGVLAGFLAAGVLGRHTRMAAVLASFLLAYVAALQLTGTRFLWRAPESLPAVQALESAARADAAPIVVEDELVYSQVAHQAPAGLKSRLVCLRDAMAARRYSGNDNTAVLLTLKPYAPLSVESYSEFLRSHNRFLIWRCRQQNPRLSWLLPKLLEDGKQLRIVAATPETMLVEVTAKQ